MRERLCSPRARSRPRRAQISAEVLFDAAAVTLFVAVVLTDELSPWFLLLAGFAAAVAWDSVNKLVAAVRGGKVTCVAPLVTIVGHPQDMDGVAAAGRCRTWRPRRWAVCEASTTGGAT